MASRNAREPPLAPAAQRALLAQLKESVHGSRDDGTFSCGGSIAFKPPTSTGPAESNEAASIDPIQIRFGSHGAGGLLRLPDPSNLEPLHHLLSLFTPASFGRGKRDIIDESYRKTGKLDPAAFATTFCPYQTGIIDVIAQLLLPNVPAAGERYRGVRAELYKLNVYSAPSGRFRAHVDTPRSEKQFGSLVVALPVGHMGGALAVRHGGREEVFDWSAVADEAPAIKWAAFYSDCEHEVLEVTSGHRLTLTYNLYMTFGPGLLAGRPKPLDLTTLPFHRTLKLALAAPDFFQTGTVLTCTLAHAYAHTSTHTPTPLPRALKGSDLVLYETAKALGLQVWLLPVLHHDTGDEYPQTPDAGWGPCDPYIYVGESLWKYVQGGGGGDDRARFGDLRGRVEEEDWPATRLDLCKVTELAQLGRSGGRGHEEAAMGYMTYGNQAEGATAYSTVSMFIRVPPFAERGVVPPPRLRVLVDLIGKDDHCVCPRAAGSDEEDEEDRDDRMKDLEDQTQ